MTKKLYRSRKSKVIAGVCGGIADYFNISPVIPRIIFIALLFISVGFIAYMFAWVLVPKEPSITDYDNHSTFNYKI